jgi:hypothetical protein
MALDFCGCIGFMRTKKTGCSGLLSRLIRMFTAGEWSHVFVVLGEDPVAGNIIIEAGETGVKLSLLSDYVLDPHVEYALYKPKVALRELLEGLKAVLALNGRSYGYLQFMGFLVVWPWYMITGRRRKNPFGGGIICSELGLIFLKTIKVNSEVFDKIALNLCSPEDLNDAIDTDRERFDLMASRKAIPVPPTAQ